jgi:hypothetical protein
MVTTAPVKQQSEDTRAVPVKRNRHEGMENAPRALSQESILELGHLLLPVQRRTYSAAQKAHKQSAPAESTARSAAGRDPDAFAPILICRDPRAVSWLAGRVAGPLAARHGAGGCFAS